MRGLIALVLLAACPATFNEATSWHRLGPGRYFISVQGNQYNSSADVLSYETYAAGKVCPGGYDVEQQTGGVREVGAIAYSCWGGATCARSVTAADAAIVVQCRQLPFAQQVAPSAYSAPVAVPAPTSWCFNVARTHETVCKTDRSECDSWRYMDVRRGESVTECIGRR